MIFTREIIDVPGYKASQTRVTYAGIGGYTAWQDLGVAVDDISDTMGHAHEAAPRRASTRTTPFSRR